MEPTKQCTKSQNRYAPETKQLKRFSCYQRLVFSDEYDIEGEHKIKKLVRRVEPTKQYTKSQNKYAPETKQLKIKGVKYAN